MDFEVIFPFTHRHSAGSLRQVMDEDDVEVLEDVIQTCHRNAGCERLGGRECTHGGVQTERFRARVCVR